jgi:hypothetical protein
MLRPLRGAQHNRGGRSAASACSLLGIRRSGREEHELLLGLTMASRGTRRLCCTVSIAHCCQSRYAVRVQCKSSSQPSFGGVWHRWKLMSA